MATLESRTCLTTEDKKKKKKKKKKLKIADSNRCSTVNKQSHEVTQLLICTNNKQSTFVDNGCKNCKRNVWVKHV